MSLHRSLATVGAVLLAGAAGLAAAPSAQATGDPVIIDCAGKGVTTPKSIVVTCADAGVSINKIAWTSWDRAGARGTGVLAWNTCLPKTCVAGIVRKYPVRITLSGLDSVPNVDAFTVIDVSFPKGGPAGLDAGQYTVAGNLR